MKQAEAQPSKPVAPSGAFRDRRVVICEPTDHRLSMPWHECGGFEQADDGPVYLVVGRDTSDEKCDRLAARFRVSAAMLRTFRDGEHFDGA